MKKKIQSVATTTIIKHLATTKGNISTQLQMNHQEKYINNKLQQFNYNKLYSSKCTNQSSQATSMHTNDQLPTKNGM